MTKFEYKVLRVTPKSMWTTEIPPEKLEEEMNQLGSEGWECISIIERPLDNAMVSINLIFKRPARF